MPSSKFILRYFHCINSEVKGLNLCCFQLGSDRSFNLAKICHERNFEIYVGDVLAIPLREGVFDVCLCIAVIHHLSTQVLFGFQLFPSCVQDSTIVFLFRRKHCSRNNKSVPMFYCTIKTNRYPLVQWRGNWFSFYTHKNACRDIFDVVAPAIVTLLTILAQSMYTFHTWCSFEQALFVVTKGYWPWSSKPRGVHSLTFEVWTLALALCKGSTKSQVQIVM